MVLALLARHLPAEHHVVKFLGLFGADLHFLHDGFVKDNVVGAIDGTKILPGYGQIMAVAALQGKRLPPKRLCDALLHDALYFVLL